MRKKWWSFNDDSVSEGIQTGRTPRERLHEVADGGMEIDRLFEAEADTPASVVLAGVERSLRRLAEAFASSTAQ